MPPRMGVYPQMLIVNYGQVLSHHLIRRPHGVVVSEIDTASGLPDLGASIGGLNDHCDECEHSAIIQPRRPSALRSLLGMKPRPAECQVPVEDVSGWGAQPCGCRNPVHGS